MVEFLAGLVAIMVLTVGLLQIGRLGVEHTRVMIDAREQAGVNALAGNHAILPPPPRYIVDWTAGNDGIQYSRDDTAIIGSAQHPFADIAQYARPGYLQALAPGNEISGLMNADMLLSSIGLVHGRFESDPIEMYPLVRRLLYAADSVTVEGEAWLVWTKGIY
jgi:hypothetical protein